MDHEDKWVDISFTVKASTLNGGSLMRNERTGETKIITDEDVLDFGQLALPLSDADISEEGEPEVPAFLRTPSMETLHINPEDVLPHHKAKAHKSKK